MLKNQNFNLKIQCHIEPVEALSYYNKVRYAGLSLIFFCCSFSAFSQEKDELGTEVVNIVKPYTPTISDAFKIKETPDLNDSISTVKKDVEYNIFSVPVASTFTPAKGKAATVEKAKPIKLYDNYATLGFGNYTSILGEFYSNFEISRTDNAGFFFRHNSSQGDIKDVRLDNKYYNTSLDANYTSRQKDASFRLDVGAEHQLYNWYGLPFQFNNAPAEFIDGIDPAQNYFSGFVGGSVGMEGSFFEGAKLNLRYLTDSYNSSEIHTTFTPEFTFPIGDVNVKVDAEADYLNGSFSQNYFNSDDINYSFLNVGLTPSIVYVDNDLTLTLGAKPVVSLNTEASETKLYVYPKVNISYRLLDEYVIAYAGVDGDLYQNTYYNFKEENPYVSPTLFIQPTNKVYEGFAGLKGKLSNNVSYNLRGAYGKENDKALFQANPYKGMNVEFKGFEYGNSFNVIYDDVNILDFFAELKLEISNNFTLGVNANYFSYTTDAQAQPWNLPDLKASLFSNFNITEKLYGGVSLFYVGERMDLRSDTNPLSTPTEVTLDSYLDANAHFGYKITDRLSVFVKGSNLLGDNYQKWYNFPVQGIQGLGGATYKFDW